MIGVFDSGRGGENAARHLLKRAPTCDVLLFADTENAPFGTKTPERLIGILQNGISLLRSVGCERILLACCTMCTVLPWVKEEYKAGVAEIITPTVNAAAKSTKNGRVAVIATERTVRSHAFSRGLNKYGVVAAELSAQPLVSIAERGFKESDTDYLDSLSESVRKTEADTLILGCTHFSSVAGELLARLQGIRLIDSAYEGAKSISVVHKDAHGSGKLIKMQTIDYK